MGRHFIGGEIDPNFYSLADTRIEAAASQLKMFPASRLLTMFCGGRKNTAAKNGRYLA